LLSPHTRLVADFCVRAKVNVRANRSQVNSIFLVQLRKRAAMIFCVTGNQAMAGKTLLAPRQGDSFRSCRIGFRKSDRVSSRIVHKQCTGNTEIRKCNGKFSAWTENEKGNF
jgi:hypothetical protein